MSFKVGDKVRVRGYRKHAVILHFYTDVPGGVVLDREVGGAHSWNVIDLVLVHKNKPERLSDVVGSWFGKGGRAK